MALKILNSVPDVEYFLYCEGESLGCWQVGQSKLHIGNQVWWSVAVPLNRPIPGSNLGTGKFERRQIAHNAQSTLYSTIIK